MQTKRTSLSRYDETSIETAHQICYQDFTKWEDLTADNHYHTKDDVDKCVNSEQHLKNYIAYEWYKTYPGYYENTISKSANLYRAFVRTLALPS